MEAGKTGKTCKPRRLRDNNEVMPNKRYAAVIAAGIFLLALAGFLGYDDGFRDQSASRYSENVERIVADCRSAPDKEECFNERFRAYLVTEETGGALKELATLLERDTALAGPVCHSAAHAIGRETLRKAKTVPEAFALCDHTCFSGCYHGVVERFLRADEEDDGHVSVKELESKVIAVCPANAPINLRIPCTHGLGHALMFFLEYDLPRALLLCDKLSARTDQLNCANGVFMENVDSGPENGVNLSVSDPHVPCRALEPRHQGACYAMQTTRMIKMGLSNQQIVKECEGSGHYESCIQSLGRDWSAEARLGGTAEVAARCVAMGPDSGKIACVEGVVGALVSYAQDGRYVYPFCAAVSPEGRQLCYHLAMERLVDTKYRTHEEARGDCTAFVGSDPLCVNALEAFGAHAH